VPADDGRRLRRSETSTASVRFLGRREEGRHPDCPEAGGRKEMVLGSRAGGRFHRMLVPQEFRRSNRTAFANEGPMIVRDVARAFLPKFAAISVIFGLGASSLAGCGSSAGCAELCTRDYACWPEIYGVPLEGDVDSCTADCEALSADDPEYAEAIADRGSCYEDYDSSDDEYYGECGAIFDCQ
jgi:hypothetical protein